MLKDSGGPYHHGLSNQLRALAEENGIQYKVDIYPYYGSDGEAFWRAGGDVAVALIGPGVDASHNYERTHTERPDRHDQMGHGISTKLINCHCEGHCSVATKQSSVHRYCKHYRCKFASLQ